MYNGDLIFSEINFFVFFLEGGGGSFLLIYSSLFFRMVAVLRRALKDVGGDSNRFEPMR